MIPPVKTIVTEQDWELYLSEGKLLLKIRGIPQVIEFRRTLATKFCEELETILRPFVFSLKGEEKEIDVTAFIDDVQT